MIQYLINNRGLNITFPDQNDQCGNVEKLDNMTPLGLCVKIKQQKCGEDLPNLLRRQTGRWMTSIFSAHLVDYLYFCFIL